MIKLLLLAFVFFPLWIGGLILFLEWLQEWLLRRTMKTGATGRHGNE